MKLLTPCAFLLFILWSLPVAADDIYTWVDEDGKTQFSNTPPPPGIKAKKLDTDSGITASSIRRETTPTEQNIKNGVDQSRAEIERNHKNAPDETENEKAEIDRRAMEVERSAIFSSKNRWLDRCDKQADGYIKKSSCQDQVDERFKTVLRMIDSTPEYYLAHLRSISYETDRILEKAVKDSERPTIKEDEYLLLNKRRSVHHLP